MSPIVSTPTFVKRLREPELDAWIRSGAWKDLPGSSAPALPALATEILELAADTDAAQARVANAVSKDPVLASRVLGFANSAASASVVTITSLNDAIFRLGTRTVCNIALADRLAGSFQTPKVYGGLGPAMRDHSIGAAYVAYLLAGVGGVPSDEAFLYGLMHDIGKLYVLKLIHDRGLPNFTGTLSARMLQLIADTHGAVGGHLVRQWGLPDTLQDPVIWHHDPRQATHHPRGAAVTYAANRLAHRYGFGVPRDEEYDPLGDHELLEMGMTAEMLADIDTRAPGLFDIARRGGR